MGICYNVECPYCNDKFEWRDGYGKEVDVLHCDKCGKELLTMDRFLEYSNVKCECGGYFDKEVPIICPICGVEIENVRQSITDTSFWE